MYGLRAGQVGEMVPFFREDLIHLYCSFTLHLTILQEHIHTVKWAYFKAFLTGIIFLMGIMNN